MLVICRVDRLAVPLCTPLNSRDRTEINYDQSSHCFLLGARGTDDYLLGKEASRATSATDRLVEICGRLSLKDQATIREMIKFLLKKK